MPNQPGPSHVELCRAPAELLARSAVASVEQPDDGGPLLEYDGPHQLQTVDVQEANELAQDPASLVAPESPDRDRTAPRSGAPTLAGAAPDPLDLAAGEPAAKFRHGSWSPDRRRIYNALRDACEPMSRLHRFATCGSQFQILQSREDGNLFKVAAVRCRDRFCVPCARERSGIIQSNLADFLQLRVTRLVTLTLRHAPGPLKPQIDRLEKAFKQLRKSHIWRQRVKGGAAFFECKRDRTNTHWHPHLHVLTEGKFIPQDELSVAWQTITTDSPIVDVRLIRDNVTGVRELAKYATKPFSHDVVHDPEQLIECVQALKHRKILYTFGTWRKAHLLTPPEQGAWHLLGTAFDLQCLKHFPNGIRTQLLAALATAHHNGQETELRISSTESTPNTS